MTQRRTDLDALRSFAMLLGIALHACLSFLAYPWPVHDTQRSDLLPLLLAVVHGFRMPLFFLLSGYFTMLVFRRRGLRSLLEQRFARIFLPLLVAAVTIGPLDAALGRYARQAIRPEPVVAEILEGNEGAVRQRLARPGAVHEKDSFWRISPLGWATMAGDPRVIGAVLDAGVDAREHDGNGNSALHVAALFGRDQACQLLLERGADPLVPNVAGRLPAAAMALSADFACEVAPFFGLAPLEVNEVLRGRERMRSRLPTDPNREETLGGLLDRAALASSGAQSTERLRLALGSSSVHLVQTNVFDHLWFLWFLCWFVVLFAALASSGWLPTGRGRWRFVAASCVPQSLMAMSLEGGFGPDVSMGLLPKPHVLAYYGCFFFFGVATFAAEGMDTRLGRFWKLLLPAALVLLVAGIATRNERWLATLIQPAYAWTMSLGLVGLFHRFFSKPHPAASWLADASYWMYLVHVPLVMVAQLLVRPWPLAAGVKFLLILASVTPLLLLSYRFGVRYTVIGRRLNGPRGVPVLKDGRPTLNS